MRLLKRAQRDGVAHDRSQDPWVLKTPPLLHTQYCLLFLLPGPKLSQIFTGHTELLLSLPPGLSLLQTLDVPVSSVRPEP